MPTYMYNTLLFSLAYLNLHYLSLNDLRLLHDLHPDAATESLRQGLRLRHLQGEDLRTRDRGERGVGA